MVTIANVVGSGDVGIELDIETLEPDIKAPYTEYNPENYHGLYVRPVEDGPLITVYRSGKYIVSGASSVDELEDTNKKFLQTLAYLDIIESSASVDFAVQNMVCTAELQDGVDLNALSIGLGLESVEYEPEQFPGLVYRPDEHPTVELVFANGKVVITGAPDMETAEEAFNQLRDRIRTCLSE